jgi:hypothetical protein
MAKESKNNADIFAAIKQVVINCSLDKNLNIDKLAIFDLEYIFLKLRAFSVDNVVNVSYRDNEDDKVYNFEIDLNDIKVIYPAKTIDKIDINETTGLLMKYPSASLYSDQEFLNTERDHYFKLILKCVDKIYFGDEIYEVKDIPIDELENFIENLGVGIFKQVNDFLVNTPKIQHTIEYTNEKGNKREIYLNSLNDFFTWR